METLSCFLHGKHGYDLACKGFEMMRVRPHCPVYNINGNVFGSNDCQGLCRRCNAWLELYLVKLDCDKDIYYVDR